MQNRVDNNDFVAPRVLSANDNNNKQDVYQNYIISNNVQLQEQNEKIKDELKELTAQCDELEEDISKEEQRRVYMKGLMHNLYDMKKKSVDINSCYRDSMIDYYNYAEDMNRNVYTRVTPGMIIALDFVEKYIHMVFFIPMFAYYMQYLTMFESIVIMGYQFIPFPIVYAYVKYSTRNINIKNYPDIRGSYIRNRNKIKEIQDKVDEIEASCRCLDDYIDEV